MSAALKHRIIFDVATRELWRVAESSDDVNALEKILSRGVDVNARNEHGMTALMRAANSGHEQVVRTLLRHGADPNITRNDKFTALALAAFFGHTDTVRVLIEHGAKTEVVTRFGTSPLMWATARTFKDAARFLENKRPAPAPVPLAVKKPTVVKTPALVKTPPVVKTLGEPPEIWDLVREAPRGFDARSAFFSRLKSMKRTYAIGVFAVLLLIIGSGVGALVLRSSEARNLPIEPAPVNTVVETPVTPPAPVNVESSIPATPVETKSEIPSVPVATKPTVRTYPHTRFTPQPNGAVEVVTEASTPPPAPTVAAPQIEKPKPAAVTTNSQPNAALSPHLVTPAKSAAPKAKVIQWP